MVDLGLGSEGYWGKIIFGRSAVSLGTMRFGDENMPECLILKTVVWDV